MTATQEKAGARLYKETLAHYQMMREGAQLEAQYAAMAYADDTTDSQDHLHIYKRAKARVACWEEAIRKLTSNGGEWLRLDFPREG